MKDYLTFNDKELAAFIKRHKGTIHTKEFPTRCGTCRFIARFEATEKYCKYLDERASHSFGDEGIQLCEIYLKLVGKEFEDVECSTEKCKRPVVAYERGDHWCAVDLKRVKKLWADDKLQ